MESERRGKHGAGTGARDSAAARGLSNDAIKLLKTQDVGYLRIVGEKVRREKDKVEHEIRLQKGFQSALGKRKPDDTEEDDEDGDDDDDDDGKPRKVVYADSQRDQSMKTIKRTKKKTSQNDCNNRRSLRSNSTPRDRHWSSPDGQGN